MAINGLIDFLEVDDETAKQLFERETSRVSPGDLEEGMTVDVCLSPAFARDERELVNAEVVEVINPFDTVEDFVVESGDYRVRITFPGSNGQIFKNGERIATWKCTAVEAVEMS